MHRPLHFRFAHDRRLATAMLLFGALACVGAMPVFAQEAGKPGAVEEVAPEIFYLRDDAGKLLPVPGFRYRDFVDLLRIKEGLPGLPQPPAAVLENIDVQGTLPGDEKPGNSVCALTITLRIRQSRAGWVRLPLELEGFVITAPPRHEGDGRVILDADSQTRGSCAWLEGAADARHTVTLVGEVAVETSPVAEAIRLRLPGATASLVTLRTARVDPAVTVDPVSLPPRVERAADGAGSIIVCPGIAGAARIRVGASDAGGKAGVVPPQATVESLVRIDGRIALTTAVIRLEDLPAGLDTLRITLPARSALKRVRKPSTLVRDEAGDAPEAVVRVERDAAGTATVELECERPVDSSGGTVFEPLGFAVEGVPSWRQRGRVSFVVEGDWQVDWEDPGANRRIDPPMTARRPGFVAAFAYDAQPASLPMRVRPRGSRISIEPTYRYEVGATRIALAATLRILVRGAPVSRVVIGLDGWGIDDVGPATLVDAAAVTADEGKVVIPFVQPLSGEAVIEIRCGRPIERAADRIAWTLPVPQADLVGPAEVTIASQSDIEILPDGTASRGLVRQAAAHARRGDGDVSMLVYRLDGTDGEFVATRRFLPQRVDASVASQATVDATETVVEQTIRFDVAHVPLEFIDLLVPDRVARSATLEVRQGGQILSPFDSSADDAGGDAAGEGPGSMVETPAVGERRDGRRMRAMLPTPLLGVGDITLRYALATAAVPPEATVAEDLPLVLPLDVRLNRQTFSISGPDALAVDVRGEAWTRDAALQATVPSRAWTSAKVQPSVPLALSARRWSAVGETVVEAAWLETRLLPALRHDAYTFSISSFGDAVTVSLPADLVPLRGGEPDPAAVQVRLDGVLLEGVVQADGRATIALPRTTAVGAARGCWLLQIESSRERRSGAGWSRWLPAAAQPVVLEPPTFPEGTLLRRFYWELRLESAEHVVVPPSRWTSQQRWQWGTFGMEQVPVVSRGVLAAWVSANTGPAIEQGGSDGRGAGRAVVPPEAGKSVFGIDAPLAERRAIYSGVGPPGVARVWVAPTWLLVLVVSGAVLAIGLSLVYQPWLRRVPVVLTLGVAATLAAAVIPDIAPLICQAALPGVALSLLAAGLRAFVDRPHHSPRPRLAPVASNSSTRFVPPPSIVIASSALRPQEGVSATGRSAS